MRGYREPDLEDEADASFRFEDQFEDDGFELTFRKYGRGRPVRVTPEERDECIDRFERLDSYLQQACVAVLIAWYFGAIWWNSEDGGSDALWICGLIAITIAFRAVNRLLWSRITSHFARRAPVGPERTLLDQYRARPAGLSWLNVGFAVFVGAVMLWLTDFERPWRLLDSAQATLALAGLLALALLKVFDRRS